MYVQDRWNQYHTFCLFMSVCRMDGCCIIFTRYFFFSFLLITAGLLATFSFPHQLFLLLYYAFLYLTSDLCHHCFIRMYSVHVMCSHHNLYISPPSSCSIFNRIAVIKFVFHVLYQDLYCIHIIQKMKRDYKTLFSFCLITFSVRECYPGLSLRCYLISKGMSYEFQQCSEIIPLDISSLKGQQHKIY